MKKIISQFIKYPLYSWLIIIGLLVAGILSINSMKVSFFPEQSARDIIVTVAYPGASPKEMEEGITVRIEEAVRSIVGIKEINSTSSENVAIVTITTTGDYDIDETLMEVKNAVDGIPSMPVDAEKPIVYKRRMTSFAMFLALYGRDGDVSLRTLKKYAQSIEEDLRTSGLFSQLAIRGFPESEISVEINEENLLRHQLTFDDISNAIARNNIDYSGGLIRSPKEEILIRSRTRSVNPNDIEDIILKANSDGSFLRIRDVATVKLKFEDISSKQTLNGKLSVSFQITKLPEENLEEMADFAEKYIEDFNKEHPELTLEITYNFMSMLGQRIDMLFNNGIYGLVLVVISLTLLLRFYLSVWVAWGIPAAFLAMFVVANIMGLTINMISLFGMILVIGILVDDGIVIGENIFSHFERGKSPRKAAVDGTIEVLPAVLTSVLTTMVAFLPLLFIKEGHMQMFRDVAIVIILSLGFSLLEAFFILPSHLSHKYVLQKKKAGNGILRKLRKSVDKLIELMRDKLYGRLLLLGIKWRWAAITIPVGLMIITVGLVAGGFIRLTIFPSIQFDTININFAFKPGTGEEKVIEYLHKFDKMLWDLNDSLRSVEGDTLPYIKHTTTNLGFAFDGQETGSHCGRLDVWFNDMDNRRLSSFEITKIVKDRVGEFPEAEKLSIGGMNRFGKPVSVSLLGKNTKHLDEARNMLKNELKKMPSLKNITDNNPPGKQEVRLLLKPEAYFLGMDQSSITHQIRQAFFGGQSQRLQEGKDELRVWVRYPKSGKLNLGQLEKMKIKTPMGEYPLTQLVDYDIQRGPVNIKRYNMSREIRVEADQANETDELPPILEKIQENIVPKILDKYPDIDVVYQGQQKASQEAMVEMMQLFIIAFFIIVIIIIIHFKSSMQAIIILMMIPTGIMGAMWGHGLRGIQISMLSAWGAVALTGVIINDAVVFLSKFNSLIKGGMKIEKAVYEAGIARFRAIVLTTVTTVVGLYPLIMETSFQAQFLIPMAVTLAYGVMFGTGFILIFFPSLILVANDIKYAFTLIWTGKKPEREELEPAMIYESRASE